MDLWSNSILLLGYRNFHRFWGDWNMFIPIMATACEVCSFYLIIFFLFFFVSTSYVIANNYTRSHCCDTKMWKCISKIYNYQFQNQNCILFNLKQNCHSCIIILNLLMSYWHRLSPMLASLYVQVRTRHLST